jgi:hypothetical protein
MQPPPPDRRLRAYAFDPSLATQLDTALINQAVLRVPWEKLEPGPVGEYLEVIDFDPSSDCFYEPVDLDDPHLLAQDGLVPSEGVPQFHQQMAYAVAMTTIKNFERALGRKALWAPYIARDEEGEVRRDPKTNEAIVRPVDRLRIYPHALREANAYYSPDKKALLFGYFPASLSNPGENLPGGLVFTCLSQDVVAHETTHALLDGLHRYFGDDTNPDVLAFHEAFADIVAMFQHFTQPEALRHQISRTRGDLASQNLLGELAHQFGQAIGNHGALRDAIGRPDPVTGCWMPATPDPEAYATTTEPHDRGAILVAAMFDAFLSIYKERIADLLRIATGGTGVLPEGNLHPDLVNRLADEATTTAGHLLRMAIRALDYCPPVDITFGEYLRALVTADGDLVPDDPWGYRIAVTEAFRRRGIYPRDVRTLAADALRWQPPEARLPGFQERLDFSDLIVMLKTGRPPKGWRGGPIEALPGLEWQTSGSRAALREQSDRFQALAHHWLLDNLFDKDGKVRDPALVHTLGLELNPATKKGTLYRTRSNGRPRLEVHAMRTSYRLTQEGRTLHDLVIELTQRRRGYLDEEVQQAAERLPHDASEWDAPPYKPRDFLIRGGCTLLIDSETGKARHCIVKPIVSETRLIRQRGYAQGSTAPSLSATYSHPVRGRRTVEPFAALHRAW